MFLSTLKVLFKTLNIMKFEIVFFKLSSEATKLQIFGNIFSKKKSTFCMGCWKYKYCISNQLFVELLKKNLI